MNTGGTINFPAANADLSHIADNSYPLNQLLKLPLNNVFLATGGEGVDFDLTQYFSNVNDLQIVKLGIHSMTNFFSLVQWGADAATGQIYSAVPNPPSQYVVDVDPNMYQAWVPANSGVQGVIWCGGFLRVNGTGPWMLVTALAADEGDDGYQIGNGGWCPMPAGYNVIQMPMAKLEWAGIVIWSLAGVYPPGGIGDANMYMLALTGMNFTAHSSGPLIGNPRTYALPGGSDGAIQKNLPNSLTPGSLKGIPTGQ